MTTVAIMSRSQQSVVQKHGGKSKDGKAEKDSSRRGRVIVLHRASKARRYIYTCTCGARNYSQGRGVLVWAGYMEGDGVIL